MKKILISSCLLGENVKYDGTNNDIRNHPFIKHLLDLDLFVPVCPEILGGLSTPRVPVEIIGKKAIDKNGDDKTKEFHLGASKAYDLAQEEGIKMAILKSRSPSCGVGYIYDGSFSKKLVKNDGVSASLLKSHNIAVFSEDDLKSAENFWKNL
ncbi:MAG: DUF523 domain-containing protein [Sulfurospirillaceae bacterium]|nr:DUF523 domain-containing protein [Sulfurospirillaceae bacterium]